MSILCTLFSAAYHCVIIYTLLLSKQNSTDPHYLNIKLYIFAVYLIGVVRSEHSFHFLAIVCFL